MIIFYVDSRCKKVNPIPTTMPLQRILVVAGHRPFVMYLRKMGRQDNIGSLPTSLKNIQSGNNPVILQFPPNTMSAPRRPGDQQDGQ